MNERIQIIRKNFGLTQEEFGSRIGGLSRNYVWMLEKGDRVPSDRTINDICREFNVQEQWLRTGEGEMFIPISRDEEIEIFIGKMLRDEPDSFKKRLISVLAKLSESEWEVLEEKLKEIVGVDEKKRADYFSPRSARM